MANALKEIEHAQRLCDCGDITIGEYFDLVEKWEDAEPTKHGRWIYVQLPLPLSDGSKECVRCSVCGTHWDNESNYCPNCGADMRKERK